MIDKCPFCGNTSQNDFGVISEWRCIPGTNGYISYKNFNVICACGATGPDADAEEEAVERWNKREAGK